MPLMDEISSEMERLQDSINALTESIEGQFESAARSIQDAFRDSPWLPQSMKPSPPPPSRSFRLSRPPRGYMDATRHWLSDNQAVTAAILAFVGTGAYIVWRQRRRARRAKRRANRTKSGAKTEVVVLAGTPHSPLTRSLSFDLERRGFIVYVTTGSLAEEQAVQIDSKPDIKALDWDLTSLTSTQHTVEKLADLLRDPNDAAGGSSSGRRLASLVVIPPPSYPSGALVNILPPDWSDILNAHLVAPFGTIHAFLPLLSSQRSTLLVLTPSITPALAIPSQSPESVVAGGFDKYISTIRREMSSLNTVQLKLGLFDYGTFGEGGKQMVSSKRGAGVGLLDSAKARKHGSSLRELHNEVFDTIVRGKGRNSTIFVGQGSRFYQNIGNWMPFRYIDWLSTMSHSSDLLRQDCGAMADQE